MKNYSLKYCSKFSFAISLSLTGLKHLAMQTRIQLQQSPMPVENITITTTSTARMPTTTTITKTRKPVKPTKKVILQKKRKQGKTCRPKRSKKCKAAKKKKSASPSNVQIFVPVDFLFEKKFIWNTILHILVSAIVKYHKHLDSLGMISRTKLDLLD